jgi:hypothetical protein
MTVTGATPHPAPRADPVPGGAQLLASLRRTDITTADADAIMTAVVDWMGAHLEVTTWTVVHSRAALAAGRNSAAAVASPGGVATTDVGLLFIRDSDPDIRRAYSMFSLGPMA